MRRDRLRQALDEALEPEERLLWTDRPHATWVCWSIACAWAPVLAEGILFAALLPIHAPWGMRLVIGLLVVVALLLNLRLWFPEVRRARYAVTDRRALVVLGTRKPVVLSYRYVDATSIGRVERLGFVGHVLFAQDASSPDGRERTGFRGITDVRHVENLLREMAAGRRHLPAGRAILDLLRAPGPKTRAAALGTLIAAGPAGERSLCRALEDADPHVQVVAAEAIADLGAKIPPGSPVLAALVARLKESCRRVRRTAEGSLERLGPVAVVPLVEALRRERDLGARAVLDDLLACLGEPHLADGLLDALDRDPDAPHHALRRYLVGRPKLQLEIVSVWVGRARGRPGPLLRLLVKGPLWARLMAAMALATGRRAESEERFAALFGSDGVEDSLVGAVGLGAVGDARAVGKLTAALKHDSREARLAAARILGFLGAAAATARDALAWHMRRDRDYDVRSACEEALVDIRRALRRQPTELQAAEAPAGRGTEPEAAQLPEGTGTEPTWSADAERRRTP